MTDTHFDQWADRFVRKVRELLKVKGAEYSVVTDRLRSFKVSAEEFGGTPAEACWDALKKHLVSIRDLARGVHPADPAIVWEKTTDAAAYLVLVSALLLEDQIESLEAGMAARQERNDDGQGPKTDEEIR